MQLEDILDPELIRDDMVDDEYLREFFRAPREYAPRQYLPPPRGQSSRRADPPTDPESPLARRSKLVGLALAGALFSGSVIAAGLTADRTDAAESGSPDNVPSLAITGVAALGGFAAPPPPAPATPTVVSPAAGSGVPSAPVVPAQGGPSVPPQPGSATEAPAASTATPPGSTAESTGQAGLGVPTTDDRVAFVQEFYRRVGPHPTDALTMLTAGLAQEQPGELIRIWTAMEQITLTEAELRSDGSVLAVVTMRHPDEGELRVTQLLSFADGPTLLISQARVLSSQHT